METRDESLPTDEPDLAQQNTDATAPVLQHVGKIAPVINPVTLLLHPTHYKNNE